MKKDQTEAQITPSLLDILQLHLWVPNFYIKNIKINRFGTELLVMPLQQERDYLEFTTIAIG